MSGTTIMLMLSVSILLGAVGLFAFIWGLKTGQFDDEAKMMKGVLYDGEDELNAAARRDEKKKVLEEQEQAK